MRLEPRRPAGCLSDLALDELLLDELAADDARAARAHLAGCGRCRDRLGTIEADRAAFSPPPLVKAVSQPSPGVAKGGKGTRARRLALGGSLLTAAAAVLLVVRSALPGGGADEGVPGTRAKGSATGRLGFYVKRGERVHEGTDGDIVHPGDRVRFTYTSTEPAFLAVLSIDGAGRLSVYHPAGGTHERMPPGRAVALPDAIALDEVLGPERILAIFCGSPHEVSELARAVRARPDEPALPAGCTLDGLTLEKRLP